MGKILLKLIEFSILFMLLLNAINCRTLSVEVNPNCGSDCNQTESQSIYLVHISSKGDDNTIHYLWSSITSIPPTLLIVKTQTTAKLTIDWKSLLSNRTDSTVRLGNAISFDSEPINSVGLQISGLLFFNDIDKKGSYSPSDHTLALDWNDFIWSEVKAPEGVGSSVKMVFSQSKTNQWYNSSIVFNLRVDSSDGRNEELPHLSYSDSSASLDFSLIDVQTDRAHGFNDTNRPRLMASMLVVNSGSSADSASEFESVTSIDDEYTPGVFTRIYLNMNSNKDSKSEVKSLNSFLHYKPIAYNSDERVIVNTLDVVHSIIETANDSQLIAYNSRILEAFFNANHSSHSFNLTFGATDDTDDDTYYSKKKYNSFSLVVGVDSAPEDKLSFLVQMIIVVGFGLPLLVMVVSALYLIVRRIRKRNFDDLLLNQQNSRQ